MSMTGHRIGIDLGGTKIEAIYLVNGIEQSRIRLDTPQNYAAIIDVLADMPGQLFEKAGKSRGHDASFSVGIGMPGALDHSGFVKNSNTQCLNGKSFKKDIEHKLGMSVAIENDANCFALSEAVDGAAKDACVVFGVIIGTGVGGGICFNQKLHKGVNGIAGEWGHNLLPAHVPRHKNEARSCYCGKNDCIETWLSGLGASTTYYEMFCEKLSAAEISSNAIDGCPKANSFIAFYAEQLAGALSLLINILDPDAIVLGGGLSGFPKLAEQTLYHLDEFIFSNEKVATDILLNCHGSSSGVRGAAWL